METDASRCRSKKDRLMTARHLTLIVLSILLGAVALSRMPFPDENTLVHLIFLERPVLFHVLKDIYLGMFFTTPYIALLIGSSFGYIFLAHSKKPNGLSKLPPYPDPAARTSLSIVLGEVHHPKKPVPAENPYWLTIPDRGLYTGIAIIGAVGSGKTSGCMYPFAEQLFAFRANDPQRRGSGLILEVKGDFCHQVKSILEKHKRSADYLEIGLDTPYRYNPLHNDLDAYALAYSIASLLNNLFGRSKEPFWQQAYTNLVKFIILIHKVLHDYVTFFDVYQGAIDPHYLESLLQEGERRLSSEFLSIDLDDFLCHPKLESQPFELDKTLNRMRALNTPELVRLLEKLRVRFELHRDSGADSGWSPEKRQQFEAVARWFHHDWTRIEPKLRTSIVEGISVFLSLFDDNPAVKRVFCPPKETYDPVANADGRYGIPMPPFAELIEQGIVCALNFPLATNPGLAKAIGTLMKQDFQRAMLTRIPRIAREPEKPWRDVLFLCDEYQSFATVGENDPSGDEKFFALSRQARCIPIVATQSISSLRSTLPGESWRTLLQTFRTKIFLSLSDDFSAHTASELCGKEEQLKLNYSLSEQGQDAGVSVLTGRTSAHRSTVGTSKGYNLQRDFIFEPKIFMELKNAQAIALAYDGLNPLPPTLVYLKPFFNDVNKSYFRQLADGEL
jgi:hypothetical protein